MASFPFEQLRQWIAQIQGLLTQKMWRRIWQALMIISMGLLGGSIFYIWRKMPTEIPQIQLRYLALAIGIYIITYGMHLMGWHTLATYLFKPLPLRKNIEAVASSTLVKYLPTIVWYIANRAHFYQQHQISRKTVVGAALFELSVMMGSGSLFYVIYWLGRINIVLALLATITVVLVLFNLQRFTNSLPSWIQGRIAKYLPNTKQQLRNRYGWLAPLAWYAGTWPVGIIFFWAILHMLVPLQMSDLVTISNIWLLSGLVSYAVSVTFGTIGVAREITMVALLAQIWPLPIALATSILVRILLNVCEIGCSLAILGWLYVSQKRPTCE